MMDEHVINDGQGRKMPANAQRARRTIGFLATVLEEYQSILLSGVLNAARERDVNLLCFAGGYLPTPDVTFPELNPSRSVLYALAGPENVDGIVAFSGPMQSIVGPEELRRFLKSYHPLPLTSIGRVEGIPSIDLEFEQGMRKMLIHLIEVHDYRRIAFIRGPIGHVEADARYSAYTSVLAEYGIAFDANLVAALGDWNEQAGMAAVDQLLDQQGADFEALVGANDRLAIGSMTRLKERGIRVPYDVAVVGFDDLESGQFTVPSLTTVHQPIARQGRQATEMLLTLLDAGDVPKHVILPARVLERRSCGCMPHVVAQAALEDKPQADGLPFEVAFGAKHQDILAEMIAALGDSFTESFASQTELLLNAFTDELGGESPGTFLTALDETLQKVVAADGNVTVWQGVLSVLRRHVLACLLEDRESSSTWNLIRIENLLGQARVMVGNVAEQMQGHKRLEFEQLTQILNEIGQALSSTFDITRLLDLLAEQLPRLGIQSCYISLYEDPKEPTEWSRLVLAYDDTGRVELEPGGRRFPSCKLVPEGLLPRGRQYGIIVEPLYFQEDQIGFALFEMGPPEATVYESLRGQISSALMGALLVQQVENRVLQIQTAAEVARAAGSLLDPDELIQQVVDLAGERFDLNYAGLFLVDQAGEITGEPDRWAVLQAGTSEAGRQMLAHGWKLEIGGDSMIGQCIINGAAVIQPDVEKAPIHLRNPFLPNTRSEMALPLTSRGQTIGALTIQSSQKAAFTQEDTAVLQTMAGQVANAIENARLFRQTQAALQQMEATHRRYLRQAWTEYLRTAETVGYETERPGMAPLADLVIPEVQKAFERQGTTRITGTEVKGADHAALVTPIKLRGAVIGALGIHDEDEARHWTDDEIALVEAVAERMALAAENLRLVDETQRRAVSEQLIGRITARMRASLDIDTVLQTAIREIGDALGIAQVEVRMKNGGKDSENGLE